MKQKTMSKKLFRHFHIATSLSHDPGGIRQQGGACTVIVNNITSRKISSRSNDKWLGRWIYVKIVGRDQRHIVIVTAYKPCKQGQNGDEMITAQQKRILKMQGKGGKIRRKQWDKDLTKQIKNG